jgi:UDP-3-O-[3-hydroxymyristoyl] glucosamine N-acyltransferase
MKLRRIADALDARLDGDENVELTGVASIASASSRDLIFVEEEKYLPRALESLAAAVIAGDFAAKATGKPLLICAHPKLAFARAARLIEEANHHKGTGAIHATAVIHSSARLHSGVSVEERAVICENAEIGQGTRIGIAAVIGRGVKIGGECEVYPQVTIYSGTTLGNHVIVHAGAVLGSDGFGYVRDPKSGRYEKFPQLGRLVIEDEVEIGANSTIDRGALDETRIGRGTKIDNLVHIGHNCSLGQNVVIAAQTGISGSVVMENDVVLGGQVGIADHVRLGEGVIVGAQGGVPSRKILRGKGVVFWGTPARPIKEYLKQLAAMARLGDRK